MVLTPQNTIEPSSEASTEPVGEDTGDTDVSEDDLTDKDQGVQR